MYTNGFTLCVAGKLLLTVPWITAKYRVPSGNDGINLEKYRGRERGNGALWQTLYRAGGIPFLFTLTWLMTDGISSDWPNDVHRIMMARTRRAAPTAIIIIKSRTNFYANAVLVSLRVRFLRERALVPPGTCST